MTQRADEAEFVTEVPQLELPAPDSMRVGAVDDPAELAADRAADQAMAFLRGAAPVATGAAGGAGSGRIRRSPAGPATEEKSGEAEQEQARRIARERDPDGEDVKEAESEEAAGATRTTDHEDEKTSESEEGGGAPASRSSSSASGELEDEKEGEAEEGGPGSGAAGLALDDEGKESEDAEVSRSAGPEAHAHGPGCGHGAAGGAVDADVAGRIESSRGGGRPLDDAVRRSMEQAYETDFSSVRVHDGGEAAGLSKSLNAEAFTTGNDVFFAQGRYRPEQESGQRLLAHELAHVVQNGAPARRSTRIQRRFDPAKVVSKAHLRDADDWETMKGDALAKGTQILVNPAAARIQARTVLPDVEWLPAVRSPINAPDTAKDQPAGYIRKSRVKVTKDGTLDYLKGRIGTILARAETKQRALAGKLDTDAHRALLADKALRLGVWNGDSVGSTTFTTGLAGLDDKLERIEEGADWIADSIGHWLGTMHVPTQQAEVAAFKLVGSDLHEHGLGVMQVTFRKGDGPRGHTFLAAGDHVVMVKPEDKTLEMNLLGAQPDSAANKINTIANLTDPAERLSTIKMASHAVYGTLVEKVKGTSAEDLGLGPRAVTQSFHETLVFAYLAGLDDLHKENVFWSDDGKPYLIDADNVLSHNQMKQEKNGAIAQSGFGTYYNEGEADRNREGIKGLTNTMNSKILRTMMDDIPARQLIIDAIIDALAGQKGRVVPIPTAFWGGQLNSYATASERNKTAIVHDSSDVNILARPKGGFDKSMGAGLRGVCGRNDADELYDRDAEKAELKKDFDAGVVPFYEYHFDSGHVTHNGTHIYNGLTAAQAMDVILRKFEANDLNNAVGDLDLPGLFDPTS